jgi:hypothetical protein
LEWTKAECCNFQQKVLGAEPVGNARKYSKDAIRHGSWTLDVDLAEGVVEEPTAAGVQTAAGIQTAAGVQTAVDMQTAAGVPTAGDIPTAAGVQSRTVPCGWRVDGEPGSKKRKLGVGQDSYALIRQWDYDDWGDATDASLALEDVLRKWLEIVTVPGAEEQIRHASLHGTTNADEVDEESNDSGERER